MIRKLIFTTILFSGVSYAEVTKAWELIRNENGIKTWMKEVPGKATVSMRGETVIPASPADIFSIMQNNSIAPEWIPLLKEKRDIRQLTETSRIEYTHIDLPWPLNDRYFINKGQVEFLENGVIKVTIQSVDEDPVKDQDKVLGRLHYSSFMLFPIKGGQQTRMELEVNSDPKGLIPKWMVNAVQKSWPTKFFTGLTEKLREVGKVVKATH